MMVMIFLIQLLINNQDALINILNDEHTSNK